MEDLMQKVGLDLSIEHIESQILGGVVREDPCVLKVEKSMLTMAEYDQIKRELDLRRSLSHPNIENTYSFNTTIDGHFYIEAEFIEGMPLVEKTFYKNGKSHARRFTRTLSVQDAVRITLRMIDVLDYLHHPPTHILDPKDPRGYVARNIVPNNIIVNDDLSVVKLCDLNEMKKIGDKINPERRYDGGVRLFPADVLPPEIRAENGGILDEGTDVYALGACLFYMLTGKEGMELDEVSLKWSNPRDREEYSDWLDSMLGGIEIEDTKLGFGLTEILLKRLLNFDRDKRMLATDELKIELDILDKNFRFAHRYTGKNILARINNEYVVYGRVKRVENGNGALNHLYLFDKAILLSTGLPTTETDIAGPEVIDSLATRYPERTLFDRNCFHLTGRDFDGQPKRIEYILSLSGNAMFHVFDDKIEGRKLGSVLGDLRDAVSITFDDSVEIYDNVTGSWIPINKALDEFDKHSEIDEDDIPF